MKVVLLAGGLGTRLAEETETKPKPMVEIGEHPILWHIMKYYSHFGFDDFYIALGYKGDSIKRFFLDYYSLKGNMTIDIPGGAVHRYEQECENWKVNLIDTGFATNTGGRVKRLASYIDDTFMLTYGDGVCNVNLRDLLAFHKSQGKLATVTAVRPPARFGGLLFDGDLVSEFSEKPQVGEGWINGGYMVLEPVVLDYLSADTDSLEIHALERLAHDKQLAAYKHEGFWQCMDTLREKRILDGLWNTGKATWKVW